MRARSLIGDEELYMKLIEDAEILDELIEPMDMERVFRGEQVGMGARHLHMACASGMDVCVGIRGMGTGHMYGHETRDRAEPLHMARASGIDVGLNMRSVAKLRHRPPDHGVSASSAPICADTRLFRLSDDEFWRTALLGHLHGNWCTASRPCTRHVHGRYSVRL